MMDDQLFEQIRAIHQEEAGLGLFSSRIRALVKDGSDWHGLVVLYGNSSHPDSGALHESVWGKLSILGKGIVWFIPSNALRAHGITEGLLVANKKCSATDRRLVFLKAFEPTSPHHSLWLKKSHLVEQIEYPLAWRYETSQQKGEYGWLHLDSYRAKATVDLFRQWDIFS